MERDILEIREGLEVINENVFDNKQLEKDIIRELNIGEKIIMARPCSRAVLFFVDFVFLVLTSERIIEYSKSGMIESYYSDTWYFERSWGNISFKPLDGSLKNVVIELQCSEQDQMSFKKYLEKIFERR